MVDEESKKTKEVSLKHIFYSDYPGGLGLKSWGVELKM